MVYVTYLTSNRFKAWVMVETGLIEREMYRLTSGTAIVNVATIDTRNRLLEFHSTLN